MTPNDWHQHIRSQLLKSAEVKQLMSEACTESILLAAETVAQSLRVGGKLMMCGNGGSAADAQHIAAELIGRLSPDRVRPALPAIALTTDTSCLTATANDYGYEYVFQRQVEALGHERDVLIGISTSGNSESVLRAVMTAKERGIITVGLIGGDGGKLLKVADLPIVVPSSDVQRIQEGHITIGHIICDLVEQMLHPMAVEGGRPVSFWQNKRVVVTGGAGFIGSHVVEALQAENCPEITVVRSRDYDLTREENIIRLLEDTRPDILIHLAGLVGGILANKERPADFFYQNLTMGTFLLHHACRCGVQKLVAAGAGCGYPEHAPMPLREPSFWEGFPQEESAPYSLAKRLLHIQSLAYYKQYGFSSIIVIPGNVYGSYDNFDLRASHVIPALVRKFVDAVEQGDDRVVVWGSGRPTRDFVYGGDVARGMLLAAEKYDGSELVNISSGVETSIREVVDGLVGLTGFTGRVVWDPSQPDGQLRRCFDVTKAKADLGFETQVSLREGLQRTIVWYKENKALARLTV